MTHSYSALYYPFIHFKDDAWLKMASLYWDRMGRIVPSTYQTEDSHIVRELGDFVEILRPEWVQPEFGETFIEFINEHADHLRNNYGIDERVNWPMVSALEQPPLAGGLSGTDPRLSYVFYEKMTEELRNLLIDSRIAIPDNEDPRWIGMHPRLTKVYMTALADQLSGERGLYPLTDETIDHLAVGGLTVERLAQILLGDVNLVGAEANAREVESTAAYVALEMAVPSNLADLSVERILEFRERYPGERGRFQRYMTEFVQTRQWLEDIRSTDVLEQRIQDEYERELKPQIDEFREKLRDVNIDTVLGAMAIQVSVPSVLTVGATLLGTTINPVGGLLAGAALALAQVLHDRRKAQQELQSSPMAYLMRIERDLRPRELTNWIWRDAVRLRPGV